MSLLVSEYSAESPSVYPVHLNFLASDEEYARIIVGTEIDVNGSFNQEMLDYIEQAVEATGGFGVFHWMGIRSAGLNPFHSDAVDFMASPEDAVLLGFTEYGVLVLGTQASHAFYWDSIVYVLDFLEDTFVLQIDSGYQLAIADANFYYVFSKLLTGLKAEGLDVLEFALKP